MLTIRSTLAAAMLLLAGAEAAPQGQQDQQQLTPQQQAEQIPQGISKATDGSTILDTNATVNNLNLRFRISGPASAFTAASGVPGAAAAAGAAGQLGLNVLLHGDGGQSFFDFPNQAVQGALAGVVVLAPDPNLFWGGGQGLDRTDGAAHSQAVADLVRDVLPGVFAFDPATVFFTGVSGGSLTLSGFFLPQNLAAFENTGVLLMCGALPPQVEVGSAAAAKLASTTIHFQSTQSELAELQPVIPQAIEAFEQIARQAGLGAAQIGALQTVNNEPRGGHCEFDGQGFSSGIQLISNNFAAIMQGGDGFVDGIGDVLTPVPGNENLTFSGSS